MIERNTWAVEVSDLTVAYDEQVVLEDVSFQIPEGTMTAIVGPNGAGKSTLVKAMLGLITPVTGRVHLRKEKEQISRYAIFGKEDPYGHIAYVPQTSAVDWDYPVTVFDVVLMGTYRQLGWFKKPGKEEKANALFALQQVGMEEYQDRPISQLSGGQQQRVFLARALVEDRQIYFLDEPFKGIDKTTEAILVDVMNDMKSKGKTLIIVHHNLQTLTSYFDWVLCVNRRVLGCGPVQDILDAHIIEETYAY